MTSIRSDLQTRKDKVLQIVIRSFVDTRTPVSSSYIVEKHMTDLSSATIRNILAELEEEGYLTHPHTSAGRVPTDKGYRYYVDRLMNEIHLLDAEKKRIDQAYRQDSQELESLLEKTSEIISDITHYTGIVSVDGETRFYCQGRNLIVQYPDYHQDLQKIAYILKALDDKRQFLDVINRAMHERIMVLIGQEITHEGINGCSLVVSSYKTREGTTGRIAVLGPTRMQYDRVVGALDYLSHVLEEKG